MRKALYLVFVLNYGTTYHPATVVAPRTFHPAPTVAIPGITLNMAAAANVAIEQPQGGYAAVVYGIGAVVTTHDTITIKNGGNYSALLPFVPVVSWELFGAFYKQRYVLTPTRITTVPYEPYGGQLIDTVTARIELWTPGNVTGTHSVPAWTLMLGNVTTTAQTFNIPACINTISGTGFAAYMTSCNV